MTVSAKLRSQTERASPTESRPPVHTLEGLECILGILFHDKRLVTALCPPLLRIAVMKWLCAWVDCCDEVTLCLGRVSWWSKRVPAWFMVKWLRARIDVCVIKWLFVWIVMVKWLCGVTWWSDCVDCHGEVTACQDWCLCDKVTVCMDCHGEMAVWSDMVKWLCGLSWWNGCVECHGEVAVWSVMVKWLCGVSWWSGCVECHGEMAVWSVMVKWLCGVSWWSGCVECHGEVTACQDWCLCDKVTAFVWIVMVKWLCGVSWWSDCVNYVTVWIVMVTVDCHGDWIVMVTGLWWWLWIVMVTVDCDGDWVLCCTVPGPWPTWRRVRDHR